MKTRMDMKTTGIVPSLDSQKKNLKKELFDERKLREEYQDKYIHTLKELEKLKKNYEIAMSNLRELNK